MSPSASSTRSNQMTDWSQADEDWLQETMVQTAIDLENGDVYALGGQILQELDMLDSEFGPGTYMGVMEDAGEIAIGGALVLYGGGYAVLRGGRWLYNSLSSPRIGHRVFTKTRQNGTWNSGEHRFGWSGRNGSDTYYLQFRGGGRRSFHWPPEGKTIQVTRPKP